MRHLAASLLLSLFLCVGAYAIGGPSPIQVDTPTITGPYTSPVTANTQWIGAVICVTVTGPVSGTLNVKMQTYDAFSNIYDIPGAAFPPITAPGTYTMLIYPTGVNNPGYTVNRPLDQVIIFSADVTGVAPSFPCQLGFMGFGT